MIKKVLDFAATEAKAKSMSVAALHYSRLDAVETAEVLDAADRANGTDLAGYYRDEAGVYAREMATR